MNLLPRPATNFKKSSKILHFCSSFSLAGKESKKKLEKCLISLDKNARGGVESLRDFKNNKIYFTKSASLC